MKSVIFTLMFLFMVSLLFADEIHLKNGEILKGAVIQITEKEVEYDPAGDRTFDIVDKKLVRVILYENGEKRYFAHDKLFTIKGHLIRCTIRNVNKESITFIRIDSNKEEIISREKIKQITFSDGKRIIFSRRGIRYKEKASHRAEKGFLDSYVRIAGFVTFGIPTGALFSREDQVFNAFKPDLFQAYIIPRNYKMYNIFAVGGGEIDVMPPGVKFRHRQAFAFTGIKFGVRGRYGYERIDNVIVDNDFYYDKSYGAELFRGNLMTYHYWSAGPVINFVFSPESNLFNFLLQIYAIGGQIFNGSFKAAAALRNADLLSLLFSGNYASKTPYLTSLSVIHTGPFNRSSFSGYTLRFGIGPHFTLNKYFPFTIGVNVTYAYSKLFLNRLIPLYFNGKMHAIQNEWGGEISAGVHL